MKIAGKHTSLPNELKKPLKKIFPGDIKVVLTDICSCRHKYPVGTCKIVGGDKTSLKVRAYFGSGIVNLFVKFKNEEQKLETLEKL